jgi:hypothetical protein
MTRAIRRKRIIFIILERERKKKTSGSYLYQQPLNVGAYRRPIDVTAMSRPTQ